MNRSRQRLFAWLGLVAFLAADPHAVAAANARCSPAGVVTVREGATTDRPDDGTACHCCRRCKQVAEAETRTPQAGPERPDGRPDCPCCPHGPACPVPGGCSLCNVAKVPCPTVAFSAPVVVADLSPASSEAPHLYASPSRGRLRRPPKV